MKNYFDFQLNERKFFPVLPPRIFLKKNRKQHHRQPKHQIWLRSRTMERLHADLGTNLTHPHHPRTLLPLGFCQSRTKDFGKKPIWKGVRHLMNYEKDVFEFEFENEKESVNYWK